MAERVRLILPNGRARVNDYDWSQFSKLISVLTPEQRDQFYNHESVITERDTDYAPEGTNIKYMYPT